MSCLAIVMEKLLSFPPLLLTGTTQIIQSHLIPNMDFWAMLYCPRCTCKGSVCYVKDSYSLADKLHGSENNKTF